MSSMNSSQQRQPAYRRIEQELRAAIASGEFSYGSRLPSVQSLAAKNRTSVFTIQNALAPLVKEGLLECTRRRGTFVKSQPTQLQGVGIYFGRDFLAGAEMAFYRELERQLSREFSLDGFRKRLWIDSRGEASQHTPLPDLLESVRNREIQGLIVANVNPVDMAWIEKLGIPFSGLTTHPIPSRVVHDSRQMMQAGLQELRRLGCRSVGLILPRPIWGPKETDHVEDVVGIFSEFVDAATDAGLRIRDEWVRTPPARIADNKLQKFGYQEFRALWKLPERPDGLLVYPDTVVSGVSIAILEARVPVPDELKVVFHRNEGVSLLCPLQASWVVTSVRQTALALTEQLQRQFAGKTVSPVRLSFALEPLGSTHALSSPQTSS